jgi:DNA-binding LacI/PurR family transcriptional regulator
VDHSSSVFAPQAAGAAGLSPAFQRREYPIEGFALKGRKIGAVVTGVEYCMKCPFLSRPYRALRHGGKFPALKRRAEPGRKAGFESVIKDYPNLRVVTELQGHSTRANGKAIMETLLQKYGKGQLQALVAQNDEMAIGASSAIQAADRLGEFKVLIGVNGLGPGLEAVASGTLTATVLQDAVTQGKQVVAAANKILTGQAVETQLVIPFQLVTKENVSSFQ